jgi:hypothetical protein
MLVASASWFPKDARASAAADRLRTPHAVEALLRRLMEPERDE